MRRDDSRPQRFAKTWLGPSLATLLGIVSTVELAAMPISAPGVQLLGPTLIQQSLKPQGGAEQPDGAPRPPAADESKPDVFIELQEALMLARGQVEELSRAAEALAALRQGRQGRPTGRALCDGDRTEQAGNGEAGGRGAGGRADQDGRTGHGQGTRDGPAIGGGALPERTTHRGRRQRSDRGRSTAEQAARQPAAGRTGQSARGRRSGQGPR